MTNRATELLQLLQAEMAEISFSGPRFVQANMAAISVGLAVVLALLLQLDDPWWAGISAFMCTQASQPQSLQKGALRIVGTLGGAAIGFVFAPWFAYDPVATMLLLYFAGTFGILGSLLSPHGYAWLLGGITIIMVTLGALDEPTQALNVAFYRAAEIILGTVTALLTALVLAPPASAAGAVAPGWRSLLGRNWHILSHATRTGVAVAAVPLVWRQLELPNLTQMAISIGAIMAVPTLTGVSQRDQDAIALRTLHRIVGCVLGGGAGVLFLATPASQIFLPWLLGLMAGNWLSMQLQNGRHGISVVGVQASVALILTLVQGAAPATSLLPAIDRVVGMLGAIGLLVLVNLLLGPPRSAEPAAPN
ncbi:FUSC family protein [Rhizobium sp. BK251]|uniref:FUSC family protein n=1 Tax=Rhizobium sp. BK251 TaxID=2512125 RepID=UPI00104444F6|nr:FUSC family protein [Rhizobium sp. BK251]TCL70387.1 fusaric acid resistance family protein [Rhizobium sp. BK251]